MTFEQVANPLLGPSAQRPNLLTNGGFEIWQRGNGPFTAGYHADRWTLQAGGTDTFSVSRDSTNQDTGSQYCAAVTFTPGTGGGGSNVLQPMLFTDAGNRQLGGRAITLSV